MSINTVTISGNLGQDPELFTSTQGGTSVLRFRMAVNERRKNQNGEWADYANWVSCVIFGNRADGIAPYLSKGSKVCVQGKLRYRQWEKDGQTRSSLEVVVDEIEFSSPRERQSAAQPSYSQQPANYQQQGQMPVYGPQDISQGYQQPSQAAQMAQQMAQGYGDVYSEEIPF